MKLLNILAIAAIGTFAVTGCTVTSTDSDAGTETGADTGATDTGATDTGAIDTGTTDTGGETGGPKCDTCQTVVCKAENDACAADTACAAEFNTSLDCVKKCTDDACRNKCVEPLKTAKAGDLWDCLNKCKDGPPPCTP
ncbi:MAG: hypothetical protein JNL79_38755 [Myxococcales bacterium]|nr:hypothetical protein [Myxococcales bacterium]